MRRFVGVLLALSLAPAVSGGAQCADRGAGGSHEHPAAAEMASDSHSGSAVAELESDSHNSAFAAAHNAMALSARAMANGPHNHHAVHAAHLQTTSVPNVSSHVAAHSCCPPLGAPGECGSAMGCSVMSAAPEQRALTPAQAIARVIVAEGAEQSPGPSQAPEVPPPRS